MKKNHRNSKSKAICFLSSMHPYDDKRVFEKEAKSLSNHGYSVIHIAPGDGTTFMHKGVEIRTFKKQNDMSVIKRILNLRNLYSYAKSTEADIFHCNEIDSWIIGLFLKFNINSKCIFDVHEHYPEEFAEVRFHKSLRFLIVQMLYLVIKSLSIYTDQIVIAKSSLKETFKHLPAHKLKLIQNFSPIKNFEALPPSSDSKSEENKFKIIHLGLFGLARGWHQLLEAMNHLKSENIELVVLGEVNDGSENKFINFINKNNLSEKIKYIKWMKIEDALKIVNECHLGLVTFQPGYHNHTHALPHKLFDYMGLGLPVLVPNFAVEVCEIVKESKSGLMIDVSSPLELSEAIKSLYENKLAAKEMGANGKEAVYNKFNWENEELVLLSMYEELFSK